MAEIKGKFITLCGRLIALYKDSLKKADNELFKRVGLHYDKLNPEDFYDTKLLALFMDKYAEASIAKEKALLTLGKKAYPLIKKTSGFPSYVKTPLDLLKYEMEGFLANHRGSDIKPRRLIEAVNGKVVISAPAPGYSQKFYEGVYLGILKMFGVKNANVAMTKGAPDFEYTITWDIKR